MPSGQAAPDRAAEKTMLPAVRSRSRSIANPVGRLAAAALAHQAKRLRPRRTSNETPSTARTAPTWRRNKTAPYRKMNLQVTNLHQNFGNGWGTHDNSTLLAGNSSARQQRVVCPGMI